MNIPTVTLKELAQFLKGLPDDAPINMYTGINDGVGCLMTQFGRSKGWKFNFSYAYSDSDPGWHDENGRNVAKLDMGNGESIFSLFGNKSEEGCDHIAKNWKNHLKEEFK